MGNAKKPYQSWTLDSLLSLLTSEVRKGSSWGPVGPTGQGQPPYGVTWGKQPGQKTNIRQWVPQGTTVDQELGPACDEEGDPVASVSNEEVRLDEGSLYTLAACWNSQGMLKIFGSKTQALKARRDTGHLGQPSLFLQKAISYVALVLSTQAALFLAIRQATEGMVTSSQV